MTGFTFPEFTSLDDPLTQSIVALTYNASDYPTLQAALNAVKATGGTLNLTANATYNTNVQVTIDGGSRFKIVGNGAKLFSTGGSYRTLYINDCEDFVIENFTVDGNRAVRPNAGDPSVFCQGIKNFVFDRFRSINGSFDCMYFTGGVHSNRATFCLNGLLYNCEALNSARNTISFIETENIQMRGGLVGFMNAPTENPAAGIDFESNAGSAAPGTNQMHVIGVTFAECAKTCIGVQGSKAPNAATNITIEGCWFKGGGHGSAIATPVARGSGITITGQHTLIRNNLFENFSTYYNVLSGVIHITDNVNNLDVGIINNAFNNVSQADPCVNNASGGSGHVITGNRGFNTTNATFVNPGNATNSNNLKVGTPTQSTPPSPDPAWEFDAPNPGGTAPVWVAKIGEFNEQQGTPAGTAISVAVTKQAGANPCFVIKVRTREKGPNPTILSVTYAGSEVATKYIGDVRGSNERRNEIWILQNPVAANGTVLATFSASMDAANIVVDQYNNVGGIGAVISAQNILPAGATVNLITTQTNSMVVASIHSNRSFPPPNWTPGAGCTERSDNVTGAAIDLDFQYTDIEQAAPTIGTYTMTSTPDDTQQDCTIIAVELLAIQTVTVNLAAALFSSTPVLGTIAVQATSPDTVQLVDAAFTSTPELGIITVDARSTFVGFGVQGF